MRWRVLITPQQVERVRIPHIEAFKEHGDKTMPKKEQNDPVKQVRLNDANHAALMQIKEGSAMNLSLTAMVNFAVEIALPEIRERFCKPTTTTK